MGDLCNEIQRLGKGIGNANRYRILEVLMDGPKTVGEIVKEVQLSQPNVSQNLRILKETSLVSDSRCGQEVIYSINVAYMTSLLQKLAKDLQKTKREE